MACLAHARLLGRAGFCTASAHAPKTGSIGYKPGDLVPSLALLIPSSPRCKQIDVAGLSWVRSSEKFFKTWKQLAPCIPKYQAFLQTHKAPGQVGQDFLRDLSQMRNAQQGKAMTPESEVALSEFYLAAALQLRPKAIDEAGSDPKALLSVARACAEEDFEPFLEEARALVSDYDAALHSALEETCPLYEVDDGLFWRANFDVAAAAEFQHFLTALGHGSGQGHVSGRSHTFRGDVPEAVRRASDGLNSEDVAFEPARRAAHLTYEKWLQACSMPAKASIIKVLMEHGFLVGADVHDSNALLPEVFPTA